MADTPPTQRQNAHPDTGHKDTHRLRPADLSDPLYYLHNARTLLDWVLAAHSDLLLTEEIQQLQQLLSLPEPSQALLFRMVMRKGEWFRDDQLKYTEIGDIQAALTALVSAGWVDCQADCDTATLAKLCRKAELLDLCRYRWPIDPPAVGSTKSTLADRLQAQAEPAQPLDIWWPDAPFGLLRLTCMPLMDRVRLMFFGNLRQDWSEFVLTELGHQTYETVPLDPGSRAFDRRRGRSLPDAAHTSAATGNWRRPREPPPATARTTANCRHRLAGEPASKTGLCPGPGHRAPGKAGPGTQALCRQPTPGGAYPSSARTGENRTARANLAGRAGRLEQYQPTGSTYPHRTGLAS